MYIKIKMRPESEKWIEGFLPAWQEAAEKGFRAGVLYLEGDSKRNFRGHSKGELQVRTGHLRRSIYSRSKGLRGFVASDVKYAAIHQFGGWIKPKRKKALRFKIDDKWFVRKKVFIPARPFIKPDSNKIEDVIKNTIVEELKKQND